MYGVSGDEYLVLDKASITAIPYQKIRLIKTKKSSGTSTGIAIGSLIGLAPALFGEGGAYAAIIAFPVGFVTGAIIGKTSKKKHHINGDQQSFKKFTKSFMK